MKIKRIIPLLLVLGLFFSGCDFNSPYRTNVKVSAKGISAHAALNVSANGQPIFFYYFGNSTNGSVEVSVPLEQNVTLEWAEYADDASFLAETPWMTASVSRYISSADTGSEIVIDPVRIDGASQSSLNGLSNSGALIPVTIYFPVAITSDLGIYYVDDLGHTAGGSSYATAGAGSFNFPTPTGTGQFVDARWDIHDSNTDTITTYYKYNFYLSPS